tara:strand:+ start:415 stop:684 length:270 start_codon:yes stop_codon:yes gene_type:complete
MADLKVLKLITNEEVIARVEEKRDILELTNPMVMMQVNQGGQMGFAIMPWSMSGKCDKVEISRSIVIATLDPMDEVEKNYIQATTGITV